ncbi:MAG: glycosyltransferase family 39 protein [Lachnospiraceae bacterium]|nr:glycosyltransferase family 39 protein [Lachnospiraceae bacterium]
MICANILLFLNIYLKKVQKNTQGKLLEAYLQANAIWMLVLFLITEFYSLFCGLTTVSLWMTWLGVDVILGGFLFYQQSRHKGRPLSKTTEQENLFGKHPINWVLVAIGVIVVLLAVSTVPYNWDSMTYRLSRVAYWAQSGSVEHFATSSLRMIANPPLGEFIQLHVYLMQGGGDRFLTMIQCAAYLTCAVVVYGITRKIECNFLFSYLAALLFMSMPIAFGEALNTQVDLLATLWLLVFVYLLLDFVQTKTAIIWSGENVFKVYVMGLCVAWGYLTKPSVCIAMVVFCIWLLIKCIVRRDKIGPLIKLAGCAFVGMGVPMGWEIARNLKTFGAISAPVAGARQLVGTLEPNYVFVNGLKNLVHNLPAVWIQPLHNRMNACMWRIAQLLNVDMNAESISEDGRMYLLSEASNYGHDTAINPTVMWLMLLCIGLALVHILKRLSGGIHKCDKVTQKRYNSYSLTAVLTFLLFCCVLRWEPFVTRYMVAFLALICPMIGICLQKYTGNKKWVQIVIVAIISLLCIWDVVWMTSYHSQVCVQNDASKRPEGYFAARMEDYPAYEAICQYIQENNYEYLGIYQNGDEHEYPYWAGLREQMKRMEHVNIYNESGIYVDRKYQPQCIIWLGPLPQEDLVWNGQGYTVGFVGAQQRYVLIPHED